MKFRKRPVVVKAVQWFPDPWAKANHFVGTDPFGVEWKISCEQGITTLEGFMMVSPGDWIITGVEGELYPCKPSIFEKTYEQLEE